MSAADRNVTTTYATSGTAAIVADGMWRTAIIAAMAADPPPRLGIDARWLAGGPPSGRNYVRHVLAALAARPDRDRFLAFVRGDDASLAARPIAARRLPNLPALLFNTVGIPVRTPAGVAAVAYQHFTPPRSRAGRLTVLHDLIYLSSPERFSSLERAYLGLIPRLLPAANIVAAVSEHVRAQVLDRWPRRDPATVLVAPNGVDERLLSAAGLVPPLAEPDDASDRTPQAVAGGDPGLDRPYVLYLGRLNTRKNLPMLIRAFAAADLPDHDLVVAGAPSGVVEDLAAEGRAAGIADRLRLPGAIDDADLPQLLRGADAFAYVSLDEGFGAPPLEAMAFGRPVVCSDIPALRETAAPGGALLVDPADRDAMAAALRTAVLDAAFRSRATECGPP